MKLLNWLRNIFNLPFICNTVIIISGVMSSTFFKYDVNDELLSRNNLPITLSVSSFILASVIQYLLLNKLKNEQRLITEQSLIISDLEEEKKDLESQVRDYIAETSLVLFKNILNEYGIKNTNSRVSLYYFDREEDKFIYISRYSEHGDYNIKHSHSFTKGQNVISKAWENAIYIDNECPPLANGKQKKKIYCRYFADNYGYDENKINELTMPSCRYYGQRISSENNMFGGVIVIESTDHKLKFDQSRMEEIIGIYRKMLYHDIVLYASLPDKGGSNG